LSTASEPSSCWTPQHGSRIFFFFQHAKTVGWPDLVFVSFLNIFWVLLIFTWFFRVKWLLERACCTLQSRDTSNCSVHVFFCALLHERFRLYVPSISNEATK
jgi:hypothetical protein